MSENIYQHLLDLEGRQQSEQLVENYVQEARLWADNAIENGYVAKAFKPFLDNSHRKHGIDNLDWFNVIYFVNFQGKKADEIRDDHEPKTPFLSYSASRLALEFLLDSGDLVQHTDKGRYTLPQVIAPTKSAYRGRPSQRLQSAVLAEYQTTTQ